MHKKNSIRDLTHTFNKIESKRIKRSSNYENSRSSIYN